MEDQRLGRGFIRRVLNHLRRLLGDARGFTNTVDMAVAAGGTIVLAAVVATTSLGALEQPKIAKDQQTADAIVNAMTKFFQDTGKWPGQVEVSTTATDILGATTVTGKFLTTNTSGTLPTLGATFDTTAAACKSNSLEGLVNVTVTPASKLIGNMQNINDYLVKDPNKALGAGKYLNWKGPYLQAAVTEDSFGRAFVINTMPLFCAEDAVVFTDAKPGGSLGFAWVLAGGGNRTVTTTVNDLNLDPTGDDAGKNAGKLIKKTNQAGT